MSRARTPKLLATPDNGKPPLGGFPSVLTGGTSMEWDLDKYIDQPEGKPRAAQSRSAAQCTNICNLCYF